MLSRGLLIVLIVTHLSAQPSPMPTAPGVSFAMLGLAPGQSMRLTALNLWTANRLIPPSAGPPTCRVMFQFYDSDGQLVNETAIDNVAPGTAASVDLNRDDLPRNDLRVQLRAVLKFGYFGGANPGPGILQQFACTITPTLEIFDNDSRKTTVVLTNAKPLPTPYPPPP
jgi:hypothetical protein